MERERTLSDMHIKVFVRLAKIGDQLPYFSVTGHSWTNKSVARRWPENPSGAGAMHKEILRAWPGLSDVVALHLSDVNGAPMHAVANGWWFYGKGEIENLSRHLRLPADQIPADLDQAAFTALVEAQRPRWAAEAAAAIAKYDLTPEEIA